MFMFTQGTVLSWMFRLIVDFFWLICEILRISLDCISRLFLLWVPALLGFFSKSSSIVTAPFRNGWAWLLSLGSTPLFPDIPFSPKKEINSSFFTSIPKHFASFLWSAEEDSFATSMQPVLDIPTVSVKDFFAHGSVSNCSDFVRKLSEMNVILNERVFCGSLAGVQSPFVTITLIFVALFAVLVVFYSLEKFEISVKDMYSERFKKVKNDTDRVSHVSKTKEIFESKRI
jgi:hypothetical protein